jgi:hypothetical protein
LRSSRSPWLGSAASRFGPVDRLRIVDETNERFYAVDRDGILGGAEVYALDGRHCLQSEPRAVERSLPESDMFSAESLDRSFVAERYRRPPESRVGDLWMPGRTCNDERPATANCPLTVGLDDEPCITYDELSRSSGVER